MGAAASAAPHNLKGLCECDSRTPTDLLVRPPNDTCAPIASLAQGFKLSRANPALEPQHLANFHRKTEKTVLSGTSRSNICLTKDSKDTSLQTTESCPREAWSMVSDCIDEDDWIQVEESCDTIEDSCVSQCVDVVHSQPAVPCAPAISLSESADESFYFTQSGAINLDGIDEKIRESGIHAATGLLANNVSTVQDAFIIDRGLHGARGAHHNNPLTDRMVLLEKVGEGASSRVHKAFDLHDLRFVAMKSIPVLDQARRRQIVHELGALYQGLRQRSDANCSLCLEGNNNILSLYNAFSHVQSATISLVVEYMDGGSLQSHLENGGISDERTLSSLAFQAAKGLCYLHGTHHVHRDLKPANLLINCRGELKISDFGVSRRLDLERTEGGIDGIALKCNSGMRKRGSCNARPPGEAVSTCIQGHKLSNYRGIFRDYIDVPFLCSPRSRNNCKRTDSALPCAPPGVNNQGNALSEMLRSPESCSIHIPAKRVPDVLDGSAAQLEEAQLRERAHVREQICQGSTRLVSVRSFVGTAVYMSPERINGDSYSTPADVWALGLSVFAVAVGHVPLQCAEGYWALLKSIRDEPAPRLPASAAWSAEFRAFLQLCLRKDPSQRATAVELVTHDFFHTGRQRHSLSLNENKCRSEASLCADETHAYHGITDTMQEVLSMAQHQGKGGDVPTQSKANINATAVSNTSSVGHHSCPFRQSELRDRSRDELRLLLVQAAIHLQHLVQRGIRPPCGAPPGRSVQEVAVWMLDANASANANGQDQSPRTSRLATLAFQLALSVREVEMLLMKL